MVYVPFFFILSSSDLIDMDDIKVIRVFDVNEWFNIFCLKIKNEEGGVVAKPTHVSLFNIIKHISTALNRKF